MESERQKKINSVLKKDFSIIIQERLRLYGIFNLIVSVTKTKVSPDLLNVKVYVSVFPFSKSKSVLRLLSRDKNKIKKSLGSLMKDQLRRIPEPFFFLDDSLDHIDKVEKEIKEE